MNLCNQKLNFLLEGQKLVQDQFSSFQELYNKMEDFEFGINQRGRLSILDAAHLYIVSASLKPKRILNFEDSNGFVSSIVATALKDNDFELFTYEKDPGPRMSALERAKYFGYKTTSLNNVSNLPSQLNLVLVNNDYNMNLALSFLSEQAIMFFNYEHPPFTLGCTHMDYYWHQDKDLMQGKLAPLLNYWNYEVFGSKIFEKPVSSAIYWK